MIIRSKQQWNELFKMHQVSGLSAAQFCRDEGLCARYFSKRKKDLNWNSELPTKIIKKRKSKKPKASSDFIQVSVSKPDSGLSIEFSELKLFWQQLPPTDWLCEFIKQLK